MTKQHPIMVKKHDGNWDVKTRLNQQFKMKHLGEARNIIGRSNIWRNQKVASLVKSTIWNERST